MSDLKIGFVGLGAMGQAIVKRILGANFSLQVYDLNHEAIQAAEALGATPASNIANLARDKEIIFVSVSTGDLTEQVICAPDGLLSHMNSGGIIIDLGTTSNTQSREIAEQVERNGQHFLDAPISGSTPWADIGELAMMVGGQQEAFMRVRPVMESFSDKIHYLGKSGNGQLLKLCHQLTLVATLTGLAEAITLAERNELSAETVLNVLKDCVAPRHLIDFLMPLAKQGNFDQNQGTLKLVHKDIKAVLQSAEHAGLQLPLAETLHHYLDQAMEGDREESDLFALVEMARKESYNNKDLA